MDGARTCASADAGDNPGVDAPIDAQNGHGSDWHRDGQANRNA
jgi:hypothetical protein